MEGTDRCQFPHPGNNKTKQVAIHLYLITAEVYHDLSHAERHHLPPLQRKPESSIDAIDDANHLHPEPCQSRR